MILRGKEIEHHNIIDDMMMKTEVIYRPQTFAYGPSKDPNVTFSLFSQIPQFVVFKSFAK